MSRRERNLIAIVEAADAAGATLEIDMEGSDTVDPTLSLYRAAAARSDRTAVALQAYLRRTPDDLTGLIDDGIARVRLVKGAYAEPASIAWQDQRDIRRAYRELLRRLLAAEWDGSGPWVGVASHDPRLHRAARRLADELQVEAERWEIQMLLGVRPQLRDELVGQGERVRISVPYGERWYPYTLRRLAERPANLLFALQAIAGVRSADAH